MKLFTWILLITVIFSCNKRVKETDYTYEIANLKSSYLALMKIAHEDAVNGFLPLAEAVNFFTSTYTLTHFIMSKDHWRTSQEKMINLHPFFPESSNSESPFLELSTKLNMRAIYPEYIDYLQGSPGSGFINDPSSYPILTDAILNDLHQNGGDGNIALGMHAIEFMLWGEDLTPDTDNGSRGITDFIPSTLNGDRRKYYLKSIANILKAQMMEAKVTDSYRVSFMNLNNEESIQIILSNVHRFCVIDFATKILKEPYISQNQRDEFSAFSDNSMNDVKSYSTALRNVLYGTSYLDETNGYFIMDFLNEHFSEEYAKIDENLAIVEANVNSFSETLFEKAIVNSGDRAKIISTYDALNEIGDALTSVASKLNVTL